MRNLGDVTEHEIKMMYQKTPALCEHFTWEEVKASEPLMIILKNQIIAHEEDQHMEKQHNPSSIFLAIDNGSNKPVNVLPPLVAQLVNQQEKKPEYRRSTITLHEKQINQLRTSLALARNCLRTNLGDQVREEALGELARSQQIINSFFKPQA